MNFSKTVRTGGNVKVELDLSHYTAKADLKGGAVKLDLASLKAEVDIHIDKLKTVPADLSQAK